MDSNTKKEEFSIPLWEYNKQKHEWTLKQHGQNNRTHTWENFRVVSYNIWFSEDYQPTRFNSLCDILNKSQAQIIGLQEMTKNILQQLSAQSFVQERYYLSDVDGRTFNGWYGVILLIDIRLHISNLNLINFPQSNMGRRLIFAEIKLDENEILRIGTVHLESLDNREQRLRQLDICQKILNRSPGSYILMGDFNFHAHGQENIDQFNRLQQWIDCWTYLMGSHNHGFTVDTEMNSMAKLHNRVPNQSRYDRIILRSQTIILTEIEILGNQLVANPGHLNIFPSDHFVDVTPSNPCNYIEVEEVYLAKVCSQRPHLTNCRLPYNFYDENSYKLNKYSAVSMVTFPNLLNKTHLRRLTIGMHTSRFLERLISCIHFIENLSVGAKDLFMYTNDNVNVNAIPTATTANLVFHRTIALLSSVFGQLSHLSLKLVAFIEISDPIVISGHIIQQLCIDHLKPLAIYNLYLELDVNNDLQETTIYNSFFMVPFSNRQLPRVLIQKRGNYYISHNYHYFIVFTSPCNDTKLPAYLFSRDLEKSCQMSINAVVMFPSAKELFLTVPWSLLTKMSIDEGDIVTPTELESILRMTYNVHTLNIWEDNGIFSPCYIT
ncbi:unnamed protein product [Rotaria magnacalcarata]|uniref:Endonuclease/exonuclease/phosphatase domain-containing protein n=1 Tax=Rotaria magnacalcarata TaxID=392030 RepID=A0A8S2J2G7_9BILA|nr:unnamed protein product [Rotaria magnacalcarata]CAF3849298.1 unnamed protein product [Rotaria magnacalcarata]CAF3880903.1 unnamed protein product [Rotaria magnacalcarata]